MTTAARVQLLVNGNVPGSSQGAPNGVANAVFWPGGLAAFEAVSSNWNAGTLTLQYVNPETATAIAVGSSTTVTANALVQPLYLPAGWYVPALTGSPTAVNAALNRIPI